LADWTAKNARAKAIIMSTLIPGSESWQIAEPLEYAADIWKALEAKYGPKSEPRNGKEINVVQEANHEQPVQLGAMVPATAKGGLAQEVSDGLQSVAELWTREQEEGTARSTEPQTKKTEEMRWGVDSLRDQRFLWALLNGGKEEESRRLEGIPDHGLGAAD
jgi:hypothetical protein